MTAAWALCAVLILTTTGDSIELQFQTLSRESEAKRRVLFQAYDAARDDQHKKRQLDRQLADDEAAYAVRFFALAQAEPHGPAAPDALYETLMLQGDQLSPIGRQAFDQLHRDVVTSPKMAEYLQQISNRSWRGVEPLLRDVIAKNPHRAAQGHAYLGLGTKLGAQATIPKSMNDPEMAQKVRARYEPEQLDAILHQDTIARLAEATACYERVVREFADVPLFPAYPRDDRTIGPVAESWLASQADLAIGKPAPAIVGHDLSGRTFRLSDYRGKVVVVVFWASWCHACLEEVPTERALAAAMVGQPFALLGVNCDYQPARAREAQIKHQITWPTWYDGDLQAQENLNGPIRQAYHVQGIPLVLVLDEQGIIRDKDPRGAMLAQAVARLLKK